MTPRSIAVIADDLTGAAEVAALGHQRGLATRLVSHEAASFPVLPAALLVIDGDTRLLAPAEAKARTERIAGRLAAFPGLRLFKKTDSVLRGNIPEETEALLGTLGLQATLLCPANPTRGRTIAGGRYKVGTVPLHRTDFGTDPHHPALTDEVRLLLGREGREVFVHAVGPEAAAAALAPGALNVGEAGCDADTRLWAGIAAGQASLLPAGGADFFSAWLDRLGIAQTAARDTPRPRGPHLLLSGSLAASASRFRQDMRAGHVPLFELPARPGDNEQVAAVTEAVLAALRVGDAAVLSTPELTASGAGQSPADWLDQCCGRCVAQLAANKAFGHLLAEGGATAAIAARALGWSSFAVAGVWEDGVVALQPEAAPGLLFTLKPGSYPWPAAVRRHLLPAGARTTPAAN